MLRFRAFNGEKEIRKSHGNLPHRSQEGAVHFITFRLQDSLPAEVLDQWQRRRSEWLSLRGLTPKDEGWFERLSPEHRREYAIQFGRVMEDEMDRGLGSCLPRSRSNAAMVASALHCFDGARYDLGDYVVMPNHVHVLVIPREGNVIGTILRSWKSYSGRAINAREGLTGRLWQKESFDHVVRSRRQLDRFRRYIEENPVKARLNQGEYVLRQVGWEDESL